MNPGLTCFEQLRRDLLRFMACQDVLNTSYEAVLGYEDRLDGDKPLTPEQRQQYWDMVNETEGLREVVNSDARPLFDRVKALDLADRILHLDDASGVVVWSEGWVEIQEAFDFYNYVDLRPKPGSELVDSEHTGGFEPSSVPVQVGFPPVNYP